MKCDQMEGIIRWRLRGEQTIERIFLPQSRLIQDKIAKLPLISYSRLRLK